MYYVYELCPRCLDHLRERKEPIEDYEVIDSKEYVANYCPKCGSRLVLACIGENKMDDTTYKIILNDASIPDYRNRKEKFIQLLMNIGNINMEEAVEKYNTQNSLISEGGMSNTYLHMNLLDSFTPNIHYTVVPEFPFTRSSNPFTCICSICGGENVNKTAEGDDNGPKGWRKVGIYCKKCKRWEMYCYAEPEDCDEIGETPIR